MGRCKRCQGCGALVGFQPELDTPRLRHEGKEEAPYGETGLLRFLDRTVMGKDTHHPTGIASPSESDCAFCHRLDRRRSIRLQLRMCPKSSVLPYLGALLAASCPWAGRIRHLRGPDDCSRGNRCRDNCIDYRRPSAGWFSDLGLARPPSIS
jgi:hypothetical protein